MTVFSKLGSHSASAPQYPQIGPTISLQLVTRSGRQGRPRSHMGAILKYLSRTTVVSEPLPLNETMVNELALAATRAEGQGSKNLLDSRVSIETVTPGLWEGQSATLLTLECLHFVDLDGCTIEVLLSSADENSAPPKIFAAGPGLWEYDSEIVTKRKTGSIEGALGGGEGGAKGEVRVKGSDQIEQQGSQIATIAATRLSTKPSHNLGVMFHVKSPSNRVRGIPDRFRIALIFEHVMQVCVEGRLHLDAPLRHKTLRRGESHPKILRPLFGVNRLPMCCERGDCDIQQCADFSHWQGWVWKNMFANVGLDMERIPRLPTSEAWLVRFGLTEVPADPGPLQPRPVDPSIPAPFVVVESHEIEHEAE